MKRIDIRLQSTLLTLVLVFMIVLVVDFWPDTVSQPMPDVAALAQDLNTLVLFDRAVADLRKRHYRQAIESFRKVLKSSPTMPEAYANIGFAHIELKQYELAKQAFNTTLELRPGQINAYWGLAVSLEGLCDMPAAIGAMKTFVHLAKKDNPYLKKANAALWEWNQLKKAAEQRGDKQIRCNR